MIKNVINSALALISSLFPPVLQTVAGPPVGKFGLSTPAQAGFRLPFAGTAL
jgi:hypothetical protein